MKKYDEENLGKKEKGKKETLESLARKRSDGRKRR